MPAPKVAGEDQDLDVSLDVENDEEAEMLDGASVKPAAAPKAAKKKSGPINVRATRDGFIYNSRKKEGDLFTIQDEIELGTWMEII